MDNRPADPHVIARARMNQSGLRQAKSLLQQDLTRVTDKGRYCRSGTSANSCSIASVFTVVSACSHLAALFAPRAVLNCA